MATTAATATCRSTSSAVEQIRERWSDVDILMRADSGFAREWLMSWCEANRVDFVIGLARNSRLQTLLEPTFVELEDELEDGDGVTGRLCADLRYRTCTP